jgi:hypothetical protein
MVSRAGIIHLLLLLKSAKEMVRRPLLPGRVQKELTHGRILCHKAMGYYSFAQRQDLVDEDAERPGHP